MLVSSYKLNKDFRSPSAATDKAGNISYKSYKSGDTVKGYFKAKDVLAKDSPFLDLVITMDGFVVPANMTTKLKDLYDDETGELLDTSDASSKVVSDIQKIANNTYVSELTNKANYSVKGATIGAVGGLAFAVLKGRSLILSALIGAFVGGLIGKYVASHVSPQTVTDVESEANKVITDTKANIAKKRADLAKKAKQVEQTLNS